MQTTKVAWQKQLATSGELFLLRGLSWLYKVRLHLPGSDATESETTYLAHLCSVSITENPHRGQICPLPARPLPVWRLWFCSMGGKFSRDSVDFQGRFASTMFANLEFAGTTTNLSSVTCGGLLDKVDLSHRSPFSTLFFPEWVELNLILREAWFNCHVTPEQL